MKRFAAEAGNPNVAGFSADALSALQAHSWPGNVRELINRVRRALAMAENSLISAEDLGLLANKQAPRRHSGAKTLEDFRKLAEQRALRAALEQTGNNVSHAARLLDVSRNTLYRMMGKLQIKC